MQKAADGGLEPFESVQERLLVAQNFVHKFFVLTLVEATLPNIFKIFIERSSPL